MQIASVCTEHSQFTISEGLRASYAPRALMVLQWAYLQHSYQSVVGVQFSFECPTDVSEVLLRELIEMLLSDVVVS